MLHLHVICACENEQVYPASCLPASYLIVLNFSQVQKKGIPDLLYMLLQVNNHYNKWNGLFSQSDTASSPSGAPPLITAAAAESDPCSHIHSGSSSS